MDSCSLNVCSLSPITKHLDVSRRASILLRGVPMALFFMFAVDMGPCGLWIMLWLKAYSNAFLLPIRSIGFIPLYAASDVSLQAESAMTVVKNRILFILFLSYLL